MLVIILIIYVITYLLSIANVAQSNKNKYLFSRLRQPWISDAIMVSLNRKYELFRLYKNGIVAFDHYNSFKNNFTTTLRHARNNYFQRKFTECSNNSRDTWKTLNSLIRYKNPSKDIILNHNGSTVSDPSAIAEVFNNYFSNVASNLDSNIPHSNTYISIEFKGSTCRKFIFLRSL